MSGPRIALDAFGTDARPEPEIAAAVQAAGAGVRIDLVGDQRRLSEALERYTAGQEPAGQEQLTQVIQLIQLVHAATEIAMDESPARAVRSKPDSSLCVAMDRLRSGEAQAFVSAGNSGAILAAALFRLGRIEGIDRPAIVTSIPQLAGQVAGSPDAVLLDAGANVECTVLNLVQFAVLGATWARVWQGVERPRVAILANGQEPSKGTALTRGAHTLLREHLGREAQRGAPAAFDFVGYIEANALFSGACDVIVTDGWTGNVALKLAEGAMAAWPRMLQGAIANRLASPAPSDGASPITAAITAAIEPALQDLAHRLNPDNHGGAPLLGVDGALIICHGAAGSGALYSALLMAHRFAECGAIQAITRAVADHRELFELARTLR